MKDLFFANCPGDCSWISKAHAAKDGDRDAQTRLAKLAILAFGILDRLLKEGGSRSRTHGVPRSVPLSNLNLQDDALDCAENERSVCL